MTTTLTKQSLLDAGCPNLAGTTLQPIVNGTGSHGFFAAAKAGGFQLILRLTLVGSQGEDAQAFLAAARPVALPGGVAMRPKRFASGKVGFTGFGKVAVLVGNVPRICQANLMAVGIRSELLPEGAVAGLAQPKAARRGRPRKADVAGGPDHVLRSLLEEQASARDILLARRTVDGTDRCGTDSDDGSICAELDFNESALRR